MGEKWKHGKIEMYFKTEGASSDGLIKNQKNKQKQNTAVTIYF